MRVEPAAEALKPLRGQVLGEPFPAQHAAAAKVAQQPEAQITGEDADGAAEQSRDAVELGVRDEQADGNACQVFGKERGEDDREQAHVLRQGIAADTIGKSVASGGAPR